MEELPIETTVYSMSSEPPPAPSRRADERHLTLFRVGTILIGGVRELCLVKNISAGGALVRAYCKLKVGQPLQLEIKERHPIAGHVSWLRASDAGIQFETAIDVIELLSAGADGLRPRMPRVEVKCIGFIREGAVLHKATIRNISQGGLSAEVPNALTIGADVTVSLTGLPPQAGVVRWKCDGRYGVAFNSVFGLPVLIEWLHRLQG